MSEWADFVNSVQVGFGLSLVVYFLGQMWRCFAEIIEDVIGR